MVTRTVLNVRYLRSQYLFLCTKYEFFLKKLSSVAPLLALLFVDTPFRLSSNRFHQSISPTNKESRHTRVVLAFIALMLGRQTAVFKDSVLARLISSSVRFAPRDLISCRLLSRLVRRQMCRLSKQISAACEFI
jgi:hypothetical protein